MGRNYRCWIVGGLRARAPVKCLCFPPCLPSKDLHILTHYGVLWSWSAWLPQPAITLIASKKLKSFKALWPHSWGKNVCLFLSISLPFSLPLSICSCSSTSACRLSIYNACLQQSQKEACKAEALSVSPVLGYFLPCQSHWVLVVSQQLTHVPASVTQKSGEKTGCVFVFVWPAATSLPRMLAEYCLSDYLSLTASLVYLSDSVVHKSSLEVGYVRARGCHVKDRGRCF